MRWLLLFALVALAFPASAGTGPTPQQFLIRSHYKGIPGGTAKANEYRRKTYTPIEGYRFFGHWVYLHPVAARALDVVETRIKTQCTDDYQPKSVGGWRARHTYLASHHKAPGNEWSNHIFGIAVDLDPLLNPCCGCVGAWQASERCQGIATTGETPLGDYAIPECWIQAFKDAGWHWLGDDPQLRDTMHFEYLAKPEEAGCE